MKERAPDRAGVSRFLLHSVRQNVWDLASLREVSVCQSVCESACSWSATPGKSVCPPSYIIASAYHYRKYSDVLRP